MAQPALPDDILHVLCEELASQDQFDTLFNCACASRVLAVPALTHLYRCVTYIQLPDFGYPQVTASLTRLQDLIIQLLFVAVEMTTTVYHKLPSYSLSSVGPYCGDPLSLLRSMPHFSLTVDISRTLTSATSEICLMKTSSGIRSLSE
jgi:hypothetical protein